MISKESRKSQSLNWLGILLSIILLMWVLKDCNFAEIWRTLKEANFLYLIPIAALIVLDFSLRAVRWSVLFENPRALKWKNLFVSMMIGYLANNILPARGGELIRIWILGKRENVPKSTVLATVMVEKVADLLVILLLLAVMLLFFPLPVWLQGVGVVAGGCCTLTILLIYFRRINGLRLLVRILRLLKFLPAHMVKILRNIGKAFVGGVSGIFSGKNSLSFVIYTALIWLCEVLITWLLAQSFHLPLSFLESLFLIVVIGISAIIPSSPGAIGTFEFFGINTLSMLGIKGSAAQAFVFIYHMVNLLSTSFIGAACTGAYYLQERESPLSLREASQRSQ